MTIRFLINKITKFTTIKPPEERNWVMYMRVD